MVVKKILQKMCSNEFFSKHALARIHFITNLILISELTLYLISQSVNQSINFRLFVYLNISNYKSRSLLRVPSPCLLYRWTKCVEHSS